MKLLPKRCVASVESTSVTSPVAISTRCYGFQGTRSPSHPVTPGVLIPDRCGVAFCASPLGFISMEAEPSIAMAVGTMASTQVALTIVSR